MVSGEALSPGDARRAREYVELEVVARKPGTRGSGIPFGGSGLLADSHHFRYCQHGTCARGGTFRPSEPGARPGRHHGGASVAPASELVMNRNAYYEDLKRLAREKRAEYKVDTAVFGLREIRRIYKAEGIRIDHWPLSLQDQGPLHVRRTAIARLRCKGACPTNPSCSRWCMNSSTITETGIH